ncbi:MAG TPA: hypothetical protein DD666_18205 [Advenella kashmirensis]|uniref:Uncharacterized protein n=1 Tax=Advenella kashmirensis TaxID=310575 RepID=A0A356LKU0_9BURK|nr:hypothetical protein [Advenella kashmirensis]
MYCRGLAARGIQGKTSGGNIAQVADYIYNLGGNFPDPISITEWVNLFALAINQENAADGKIVQG